MNLNEYQEKAVATAVYPDEWKGIYPVLGLANEAGEVAGKAKKILRGDYDANPPEETKKMMSSELGDVLWYLAVTASDLGISLEEVADENLAKLADRQERGVLKGSGDTR